MAEIFEFNNYEIELKEACFLDFYVTQYWWASKQKKLGNELTSAYFSLIYTLMNNLKSFFTYLI
jgi:hypothetical protein